MSTTTTTDELMVAYRDGDLDALNELAARILPKLHSWFLRRTRDWHLAEDLASETIMKLCRYSCRYQDRGQFGAWMRCVAKNVLFDFRKKSRLSTISDSQLDDGDDPQFGVEFCPSQGIDPVDAAIYRESWRLAEIALATLPHEQAEATWGLCSGESVASLASRQGVPEGTVKTRAMHGRRAIRSRLMSCDAA